MSENKDFKEEVNSESENIENTVKEETNSEATENSQEIKEASAKEKYAELNDKFLRLYSEFDNYRKRTNKEKIELIGSASAGLMKDLIPVLDDFERAILNNENVTEIDSLKEGFTLIFTKFKSLLEAKGLKQMNAKGESFDSELHEAIANIPTEDESLKGKVIDDVEKGYFLNEKVVRYAKVVVGQ
jgi:molecular chaperone GrpE